ncbi:hypothetical protein [Pseudomonas sp. CNPSo 3701]|uniref:hypothetical protein n=1 Tax=Pseudomonas sp. CNPSo 3701 TaxID=3027943 RepID=UPI0023632D7A|nr:hypothetical protein [Pseudomonas sp. CNPSo 3701]MDD1508022.1 hypothetical protein [Pseudomonas sp. CNPSo 3701]
MQILSAYLLESTGLSKEEVFNSAASIEKALDEWLIEKGAPNPAASSGNFISKTRGSPAGQFQRRDATSEAGTFRELTLLEPTTSGQQFITTIAFLNLTDKVVVYATLAVQNIATIVAPVFTDPRCPFIVKKLLGLRPDWHIGNFPIPNSTPQILYGAEGGHQLKSMIQDSSRTLPIAVVSEVEQEPIWEDLENLLATDLAGLAGVVRIDEEASWVLTDELGKSNSCYLGAIRLYWPREKDLDESLSPKSSVWTASQVLSQDTDGKGMQRFRALLRRSVMGVASLTVEPPSIIREIQNQAARTRLLELEQRANANSEEIELARLFIQENEELKASLDEANREIARQASKAEAAEYALNRLKENSGADGSETEDLSERTTPTEGETRYYKKTRNTPSHDVLVRIKDCGHNSWQGANNADKAKKGVERLEGASAWNNFYHCSKCTGGGVWKVIW